MTWLWNRLGWFGRLKARFWAWAVMAMALMFGGSEVLRLVTHDEISGRVAGIAELCTVKCDRISQRPPGIPREAVACGQLSALLRDVEGCRPKPEHHYVVTFPDASDRITQAPLPVARFEQTHRAGERIRVLREPDGNVIHPPPEWFDFGAFAVGLGLLYWLVLRRLARWFPSRTQQPGTANTSRVPKTRETSPPPASANSKPRDPIVKQHQRSRRGYIVNGPIRTRKR